MMLEWNVSIGSLVTATVVLIGFIGNGLAIAVSLGRHFGTIREQIKMVDTRLERLESNEERLTEVLVSMAQSRTELTLLSKRIDDLQKHGSYRLAEILTDRLANESNK